MGEGDSRCAPAALGRACAEIENRGLASVAEDAGLSSPYQAEHYSWWHETLRAALDQVHGVHDAGFTAHALLAAVRADLVMHLIDGQKTAPEDLRASLAAYIDNALGDNSDTTRPEY